MARNIKLTLAYDGYDFAGWQVQPDRPTIQGTLVSVIEQITGETTLPQGSGRTDAGVHALAQVATVAIQSPIPLLNFRKALNHVLPRAIRVLNAEEVSADFHARKSAHAKTYRYRIYRGEICSPFLARYVYHHPYPLDQEAMAKAADVVIGEHDFTSFAAVDPEARKEDAAQSSRNQKQHLPRRHGDTESHGEKAQRKAKSRAKTKSKAENGRGHRGISENSGANESRWKSSQSGTIFEVSNTEVSNVRTIYSSSWQCAGEELVYTVRGNGFLHHMVRNLVGTFLMIGKGGLTSKDLKRILDLRDRSAAAATAPASGLYLVSVEY